MKTLIDRRRSQPFREFLDSPSWLKEEPTQPARAVTDRELLRAAAASVLLAVLMFALLVLWPIGERISR